MNRKDKRFALLLKLPLYLWTVLFVLAALGYVIGLSLQSRGELAILRLLGLARRRTGALAVGEVLIPALLGLLLGLAAARIWQWQVLSGAALRRGAAAGGHCPGTFRRGEAPAGG